MGRYLIAENLKFKRTFLRKLLWIVPLFNICISFFMNPQYLSTTTFNLWAVIFMPLMIALICGLMDQKEKKASNYNSVFLLPINLKIIWYTKISLIGIYTFFSLIIFVVFMFILSFVIPSFITINSTFLFAVVTLWISTLWQIPVCLFLAKKFGFIIPMIINCLGSFSVIFMAAGHFWWLSPWNFSTRMMSPIMHVHPNGTILESGSSLLDYQVVPIGLILSAILFLVCMYITSSLFSENKER